MERTQFTWYESFTKAAQRIKNKAHRCVFYDTITAYAHYGTLPDMDSLPDSVSIAFELIKPNLDASRRKAVSGKKGGESKQTGSKPEANAKQTASKKEDKKENEKENENKKEDECPPKSPFSVVLAAYANKINACPSDMVLGELRGFVESMGQECCLRAIDIALDEKKATWSYIRGILKAKREQGVRSLADWDSVDAAREAAKSAKASKNAGWEPGRPRDSMPSQESLERSRQNMEQTRRILAMMKEEENG